MQSSFACRDCPTLSSPCAGSVRDDEKGKDSITDYAKHFKLNIPLGDMTLKRALFSLFLSSLRFDFLHLPPKVLRDSQIRRPILRLLLMNDFDPLLVACL